MIKLLTALLLLSSFSLFAEPYLAIKTGLQCAACHSSPTGGGMRTELGQAIGRTLSVKSAPTSGMPTQFKNIRFGGDIRTSIRTLKIPSSDTTSRFQSDRTSVYVLADIIANRLSFYFDQQFAPASENRTSWLKLQTEDQKYYLRTGKFFLPYGFRLEDDTAFIRQVTGVNFASADNG